MIQGIEYYKTEDKDPIGLMHRELGGYRPGDIKVVAAFDIDARKVGKDVSEAIFAPELHSGFVLMSPSQV